MSHVPSSKSEKTAPLYERDLYAWVDEQVRLLRSGRLREVDAQNVAEELSDVGSKEYDKLESALRVLLAHILKWDHEPAKRSRSWENTIRIQRAHVLRQLKKNPSLKSRLREAVNDGYEDGRADASSESDIDLDRFPDVCPYDWDAIMNREFKR